MTPEWLSGTYKRYKADTDAFTSWLTSSAINLGYKLDELEKKAPASAKKSTYQPAIKITVGELLDQAKYLASHHSRTLVPAEVVGAARRALEARSKCCEWYQSTFTGKKTADHPALEEQNQSHEHFIRVLKAILDILKPSFAPTETLPKVQPEKPKTKINVFELLEVDDCPDDDILELSDLTISRPKPNKPNKTTRRKNNPKTESSWIFQAFCTFQDFNDIRQHVMQLWKGYRDGKVDLIVASTVTEVAFHLMEKIEKETLFPEVNGEKMSPLDVAAKFMEHCCYLRGQPKIIGPGPMWDVAEWLSLTIKPNIDQWTIAEAPVAKVLRKCYGTYDPSADRAAMSDLGKYCEDCTILTHIIFDTTLIKRFGSLGYKLLIQDKVTIALADLGKLESNNITSLWLCFAVQMLLDIHLTLRVNFSRPCKQMRVVAKLSRAMTLDYGKFLNTPSIKAFKLEKFGVEDEEHLQGLKLILDNIEDDVLGNIKNLFYERGSIENIYETVQDAPFSQNPVLCGMDVLGIYLHLQEGGVCSADSWWTIMPMAHLYNALRKNGYLSTSWPRMEKLIEIHTPEYIFFGGAPSDLKSCHSKIRLSKGIAADMNASNARSRFVPTSRPKRLFAPNLGSVSGVLHKFLFGHLHASEGHKFDLLAALNQLFNTQAKAKNNAVTQGGGSLDLLNFVQDNLSKELAGLKFNYWALNQECINILRLLLLEFVDTFKGLGFRGYEGKNRYPLIHVAEDLILLSALDSKSGRSPALTRAATILQESLGKK